MRTSCNGCRALRKACGEDCAIKPSLKWIKSPESQVHTTLFLAKFYGRAGLLNLLNSGADTERPAIFRSLLYEACGRIINPVYGSVGLLHSGQWQRCQSAVEAILRGVPITSFALRASDVNSRMLHDIRHVPKYGGLIPPGFGNAKKVKKARAWTKRAGVKTKGRLIELDQLELTGTNSHQSSLSHQSNGRDDATRTLDGESKSASAEIGAEKLEDALELTLGFQPIKRVRYDGNEGECNIGLGTSVLGSSISKF
ncbi:hypothetical protein MLD38_013322 [Melastoma candidum]|uniref:Uncharacterized protein n=1 Tax=Melastoma candidum TaxID=119954 RepID=A0ACB9RCC2_9MYRT|nr:hypothetical protein MLD38_013322 [Melastoma candidum]